MSNNYTLTSFEIENINNKEALWWVTEYEKLQKAYDEEDDYDNYPNVSYEIKKNLWIWSEESFNIEALVNLISDFLMKHRPNDYVSFTWAFTNSGRGIDEFSGGGVFITAEETEWFSPYTSILAKANAFRDAQLEKENTTYGVL